MTQFVPEGEAVGEGVEPTPEQAAAPTHDAASSRVAELEALVAERTADLQRLQAEYVNYKRRVDRDRDLARGAGVESVMRDLLPVLDSIALARSHDEVNGGFKLVADEIERVTAKYDVAAFGEPGDPFDPQIHEALMQVPGEGHEVTTAAQILQVGYKIKDRVVRPARVAVAEASDPAPDTADPAPDTADPGEPEQD